jgi:hypothetical protein
VYLKQIDKNIDKIRRTYYLQTDGEDVWESLRNASPSPRKTLVYSLDQVRF